MDTFLAVASRREVREYAARPIPDDAAGRILEAGRISGSARNRQPWRFVVVGTPEVREQRADAVHASDNVRTAALVVVIAMRANPRAAFDAGRVAQNMMLTAWNEHIGACPNGAANPDTVARLLGLDEDERPEIILTFGYPLRDRDPESRSAVEWLERADRKPLDEVVRRV